MVSCWQCGGGDGCGVHGQCMFRRMDFAGLVRCFCHGIFGIGLLAAVLFLASWACSMLLLRISFTAFGVGGVVSQLQKVQGRRQHFNLSSYMLRSRVVLPTLHGKLPLPCSTKRVAWRHKLCRMHATDMVEAMTELGASGVFLVML